MMESITIGIGFFSLGVLISTIIWAFYDLHQIKEAQKEREINNILNRLRDLEEITRKQKQAELDLDYERRTKTI